MLSLYDFNALNDNEKAEAVWHGTFLADRQDGELTIQLYSLTNFYVEVFYDPKANRITGFRSFNTKSLLVPYLSQIRLDVPRLK